MDNLPSQDLDSLDRDALLARLRSEQEQREELIATLRSPEAEIERLEAELEFQIERLSTQSDELRVRSERIEHLKLMVEKYRHLLYGTKSEKMVAKIEQLDLRTVLAQIADHPVSHIQDLLPWNLAPALQTHSSRAA
jgi:DNA repair ATPase RecN